MIYKAMLKSARKALELIPPIRALRAKMEDLRSKERFSSALAENLSLRAGIMESAFIPVADLSAAAGAAAAISADKGFLYQKLFILGSGPSLLELTAEEKLHIESHGIVAMNRYLLFWEKIGIWPQYSFLADSLGVGRQVFRQLCLDILLTDRAAPLLLLESAFKQATPRCLPSVFFTRDDTKGNNLNWADSLEEPLFFCRGSLSSLINLAVLLKLAPEIILVGVDLNAPGSFFEDERANRPELFNDWDLEANKLGKHASIAEVHGFIGSILDGWSIINHEAARRNIKLSSFSDKSLLVEEGMLHKYVRQ